jgi:NADH-quinone oxidoreductase subunit M
MSFCLLGVASLSAAGLAGALVTAFTHGLGAVLAFSVAGAFGERPLGLASLDGLGGTSPGAARWLAFALAASAAGPGLATFVGPTLVALDVTTRQPWIAVPALAAFAAASGACVRAGAGILSRLRTPGAVAATARSPEARTLAVAAPVAAMLLALGIVPAAMLDAVGTSVLTLLRFVSAARS